VQRANTQIIHYSFLHIPKTGEAAFLDLCNCELHSAARGLRRAGICGVQNLSPEIAIVIEPPHGAELEVFSDAVGHIYETALDPAHWTDALRHINLLTKSSQSVLHWADTQTMTAIEAYHVGMAPALLELLRNNAVYWSIQVDALNWTPGHVHYLADLLPREELERGRFYREVLKPSRQLDYIGMHALVDGKRLASMSVNRSEDEGMFFPRSVDLMRLIAPHICRAAKISAALDLRTLRADMLQSTLDTLSCGVVLLDASRGVLYCNAVADRMLKQSDSFSTLLNKLKIKDAEADAALESVLASLRDGKPDFMPAAIAVANQDQPMALTVMPVAMTRKTSLFGSQEVAVAVFIQSLTTAPPIPREILSGAFGLTPKEVKVVLSILQGFDAASIADILGIEESTVRSHIKSIMSKCGVSRQADLVQLLMRASSPVQSNPIEAVMS
jgi:DNA-binding CsgD family transcriptional regulator/PAS domain-containing protein